ncbi:lipase-like protein 4 [Elsinoe australis]|uniref:Lipase-like protein 4 n=1 Tax=Elsinoe australis TaxID=40998 RepID=A0A4U7ATA1_9PEZI|nr:lipase-like protein 4 [Elsinoe australis]
MSDFNLFQQICIQIFTANLAGAFFGTEKFLQRAIDAAANHAVDKYLAKYGWKITWGPRVWKSPDSHFYEGLDNCWMITMAPGVVYPDGAKYDTYVVAIAGTAVFSAKDWVQEDFGVDHVIPFDAFTKTFKEGPIIEPQKTPKTGEGPFCAWGTAWGAYQIVTNTSPEGNPGAGTTILQYLAGLNKDGGDFRVIFTGHSLGGALSPFLSLAAKANSLIPALATTPDNILTFPAAGATPGDGLLGDAYGKLFPVSGPGGYQQWNTNLFNTLDIVPQAWSTDDTQDRFLDKIVGIYGTLEGKIHHQIEGMVGKAKSRAEASGIIYQPIEGNPFTGTPPDHPPKRFLKFIFEAVKQHTKAYHDEVGVGKVLAQIYLVAASIKEVEKKNARQAAMGMPVIRFAADLMEGDEDDSSEVPEGNGGDFKAGIPDDNLDGIPEGANTAYPYDCILDA